MKEQSKALTVNNVSPGSQELRNRVHERYARFRAQCLPRADSLKEAARTAIRGQSKPYSASSLLPTAYRLESRKEIAERIQYLSRDAIETVARKRQRLEEALWSQHEADIGDYFEQTPNGIEQPKRLSDMSPEIRKNIEKVVIDAKGRIFPQLYNKQNASKELRSMLAIGRAADAGPSLSDAELVAQLSEQAKQLGVEIDLNFRFAQQPQADQAHESDTQAVSPQVIDNTEDSKG